LVNGVVDDGDVTFVALADPAAMSSALPPSFFAPMIGCLMERCRRHAASVVADRTSR
jgi:hypothetical protein